MDFDSLGKGVFRESMAAYIAAVSPDVVLALVRVALAAQDLIDWDDGRHYGQEPPLATLRDALADLDR
jgi:hypothetical protein